MNPGRDTFGSGYEFQRENEPSVGKFTYGLGMSLGVLVLIIAITVTSYFCTRNPDPGPSSTGGRPEGQQQGTEHMVNVEGIDEETLKSYPKCFYSELEKSKKEENGGKKGSSTENSCSVCLGEYKGSDIVRELGECGHVFHVKCVDYWLRLNPTCPLCRTSPLLTPHSTPLAHVVPLALNLRGG